MTTINVTLSQLHVLRERSLRSLLRSLLRRRSLLRLRLRERLSRFLRCAFSRSFDSHFEGCLLVRGRGLKQNKSARTSDERT